MVKNLPASAGDVRDLGSIAGLGRSPGGGHGNPLQYSCLENLMDWQAIVHGVAKSWTLLSTHAIHQKSPDTPGSLEGNTEGPGTASSEPLLPS